VTLFFQWLRFLGPVTAIALAVSLAAGFMLDRKNNGLKVMMAEQKVVIAEQNLSIGVYKQQATNQAERVKEANIAAQKSGEAWKRRLAKASEKSEQPPPATDYSGPLQACLGTVEWMRNEYNKLAEIWDAK
jgi:hypothetical protein